MGIHRLPRIINYLSKDDLVGVTAVQQSMSLNRFWVIWNNQHVVNNDTVSAGGGPSHKIKPVVDCLSSL